MMTLQTIQLALIIWSGWPYLWRNVLLVVLGLTIIDYAISYGTFASLLVDMSLEFLLSNKALKAFVTCELLPLEQFLSLHLLLLGVFSLHMVSLLLLVFECLITVLIVALEADGLLVSWFHCCLRFKF